VSDFLAFSREPILETRKADINAIVGDAINAFRSEKEIDIKFKAEKDALPAQLDPDKLYQVLLNLLQNSWQAMEGRGGMRINTRETWVKYLNLSIRPRLKAPASAWPCAERSSKKWAALSVPGTIQQAAQEW